nr:ribulose-1,5-bisphosphate carboxylase small subunit, N-terminal [Tanacetum cinerariifolium]
MEGKKVLQVTTQDVTTMIRNEHEDARFLRTKQDGSSGEKSRRAPPSGYLKISRSRIGLWPPRFRATIKEITDEPDSIATVEHRSKKMLLLTWNAFSEPTEEPVYEYIIPRSPGYYDGRYWTMWKLPMFGCTDSAQVIKELEEAKKEYPNSFIRIIGFDNVRQVQCISFIAHKPPGY